MALNDLTVSPVTGRCENRRHQGRVRENEPPGGSRSLAGTAANRKLDYSALANYWEFGATFTNTSAFIATSPTTVAALISVVAI